MKTSYLVGDDFRNGEEHPNCFDNINKVLEEQRAMITPVKIVVD